MGVKATEKASFVHDPCAQLLQTKLWCTKRHDHRLVQGLGATDIDNVHGSLSYDYAIYVVGLLANEGQDVAYQFPLELQEFLNP
jgi:hypothetical protein